MDVKLSGGSFALGPGGLPETVEGLPELLQRAAICIRARRGSFPYDRELGSGLADWYNDGRAQEEHQEDRALALANEGLLRLSGVRAVSAWMTEDGVGFRIATPLGEGEIEFGDL